MCAHPGGLSLNSLAAHFVLAFSALCACSSRANDSSPFAMPPEAGPNETSPTEAVAPVDDEATPREELRADSQASEREPTVDLIDDASELDPSDATSRSNAEKAREGANEGEDGVRQVVASPDDAMPFPSERYLACRRLLVEEQSFSLAEHCFSRLADESPAEAPLARDMASLAHDLGARERAARATTVDNRTRLGERLMRSGAPEGLIGGALSGGIYGFLGTATVQSFWRTDNARGAPWLLGLPAATLLAGGGLGLLLGFVAEPGDASLVSSSSLIGIATGTVLQAMLLWRSDDVREIPLRFLVPLATGLAFTALSMTAAPFIDVTPGDAALATSAALWAPFFATMLTLTASAMMSDLRIRNPSSTPLDPAIPLGGLLATSLLAWVTTLALHPLVDIPRPATWLIEIGALAGATLVTATLPFVFLFPQGGVPLPFATIPLGYTVGMAAGAGAGLALAFVAGALVPELDGIGALLERTPVALTPIIAPDPVTPTRTNVSLALTGALPW
jgi:hypothetical protein